MKGTLKIGRPYIAEGSTPDTARLFADVQVNTDPVYTVWYEVGAEYRSYLCDERLDGIVVNLLLYAMEHELDIDCDQVLSERLYYQLNEYFIPTISKNIKRYHAIKIKADTARGPLSSAMACGASLSGGVDSFYTLLRHIDRKKDSGFNITHLTFFNAGGSGEYGGEEARKRYRERIDWIKDVAVQLDKKLVTVDTNINEFLMQNHLMTHTFRTLAIPLLLQKLFSVYLFSSSDSFHAFCFTDHTPGYYDLFSLQCLSTENIVFYSSGGETTRMEKLQYISDFELTHRYLNVCVRESTNCSQCEKCKRTMVGLYALGSLGKYNRVFDLDYFHSHLHEFLRYTVAMRKETDWNENYFLLRQKKTFSATDYILGNILYIGKKIRKVLAQCAPLKKMYHSLVRKG